MLLNTLPLPIAAITGNNYSTQYWSINSLKEALINKEGYYNSLCKANKLTATGKGLRKDIKQIKEAIKIKS